MASTYSPSLRIELIGAGEQAGTWNTTTNSNLGTIIESAIAGYVAVSVTSANQAFTASDGAPDQARNAVIALTTTTTANFAVYAPPQEKTYIIYNTTAYTATIYNSTVLGNTTAAGLGVAVAAGKKIMVFSDGTNFREVEVAAFAGVLPVVNGGTGVTTSTGTGNTVLSTSPTLVTPALGTPTALVGTNITGTAAGLSIGGNAATATTATGLSATLAVASGGTGAATLTANNVVLGNGTSAVQFVAPSTTGNVLTSNGTTWTSTAPASTYVGARGQVFTSTGTFTVPTGITAAKVTVIGGGGSGGDVTGLGSAAGGGGGGGVAIEFVTGLTPGGTVTVTVGGVAGTSSFGAFCSATGGATAASVSAGGAAGAAGAGGAGSGGDINISGGAGSAGNVTGTNGAGSGGGSSGLSAARTAIAIDNSTAVSFPGLGYLGGVGGIGTPSGGNGTAATGFGNGGGGAYADTATDRTGGAGSGGIVVVEF
jgi:hypothetical protein